MKIYDKVDLERVEISQEIQVFDHMQLEKSIYDYIGMEDQILIYEILKSVEWSVDAKKKKKELERIANKYWLTYLGTGTNRIVLECKYDNRIVIKIPFKETNLCDGANEMINQQFLKPGICKTFDVGFMGVASIHEKVVPVKYQEQLQIPKNARSHFELINNLQHNGFMFDDVGKRNFRNLGIREGFGVVIIDYPSAFKIPSGELVCKLCGGRIDYIAGFDRIECLSCGKVYSAQAISEGSLTNYAKGLVKIDYQQKGKGTMAIKIINRETGKVILETESIRETKTVDKKPQFNKNPFTSMAKPKNVRIRFDKNTMVQKDPVDIKSRKNPGQKVLNTKEVPIAPQFTIPSLVLDVGIPVEHKQKIVYSTDNVQEDKKTLEEACGLTFDENGKLINIDESTEEKDKTENDKTIPLPNGNVSAEDLEKIEVEIEAPEEVESVQDSVQDIDWNPEKDKRRDRRKNNKFKKKYKFNYDINEDDF